MLAHRPTQASPKDRLLGQWQHQGRRPLRRRAAPVQATGSTFGHSFRVTTFGESHGGAVGCVIDGVPPRLRITKEEIQYELDRRRPGQSKITTPRKESDTCELLSGMAPDGTTTLGTPICVVVRNKDQQSGDYSEMEQAYRPSHADATYDFKYGIRAVAGGGRSSARETIGRVAAGAVAKKLLQQVAGTEVLAYVNRVRDVEATGVDHETMTLEQIESNPVRCPDQASADLMYKAIDEVRTRGESCGGEVTCVVRGCPKGLGTPVFDKLEAELAKAIMSLPATKGFEIGSGFSGSRMLGSEHNDEFYMADKGEIRTRTNRSGGVQGGISNGEQIVLRVAFKPTATIARRQATVSRVGQDVELLARGRHDPCVVPRAVPMVESMVALVLADQLLQHYAQCELLPRDDALGPDSKARSQFQLQHL
ncbi:hypothetical protein CHLNCDRAFT_37425 [Chlorella variabilis]|uniref:Chorismate synthase n=1 Tax=Chlorella variabilis TaxID=554065 RepID=E1ZRW2_CHLVA|nr:hypothetical protein CHLNCDRAFT_37425 [Chlorella variabilis]EFN51482.1 hypothetical protein CHLNCDRAFT_37425 [Chlorella variabilis]|eukprot:XP_005843584.1 hypothetical protein CHLNCDRAFT_37425 [Chlorella variabilis]